ncbi:MAG: SLBB domain-containing protein [Candidatus Kapaibacterium sp.]
MFYNYFASIFRASIFILLIIQVPGIAQIDYNTLTGAKKGVVDTLGIETSRKISQETAELLEREIDPEKYIVGPEDVFRISVIATKPQEFSAKISPEGKLLLKGSGIVDLKGKTLAESYNLIKDVLRKTYRSDEIYVILEEIRRFKVVVTGKVVRNGIVPASAVLRVSEVIDKTGGLVFESSLRYIEILRSDGTIVPVDLLKFYAFKGENDNPTVLGGDLIKVPPKSEKYSIQILGDVNNPGEFEFVEGDSLSHLISFAQGFTKSAFLDSIEVARFTPTGVNRFFLDLSSWRDKKLINGKLQNNIALQAGDRVFIRKTVNWFNNKYAVIDGEIKFPGKYPIQENAETLTDLIERAGGVTEDASLSLSEFIRQSEIGYIDPEILRIAEILPSERSKQEKSYYEARVREKRGAMAIDFENAIGNPGSKDNIAIKHRDSIVIANAKNLINVQGHVYNPGLVRYNPDHDYEDYIKLAGGYSYQADKGEVFIVKPRGEQFRAGNKDYKITAGDVILVPPKEKIPFSEQFSDVVQVVFQLSTIIIIVVDLLSR